MLVNLTEHAIRIRLDASNDPTPLASDVVLAPSGIVARCQATTSVIEVIDGIPVSGTDFGAIEGLPLIQAGVILVTSTLVAQVARRSDTVSPLTDRTAIRTPAGQVFAVRGLQTFAIVARGTLLR